MTRIILMNNNMVTISRENTMNKVMRATWRPRPTQPLSSTVRSRRVTKAMRRVVTLRTIRLVLSLILRITLRHRGTQSQAMYRDTVVVVVHTVRGMMPRTVMITPNPTSSMISPLHSPLATILLLVTTVTKQPVTMVTLRLPLLVELVTRHLDLVTTSSLLVSPLLQPLLSINQQPLLNQLLMCMSSGVRQ